MSFPTKITWGFDPNTAADSVFKNATARLVWAIIKTGHITDQHFNDSVLKFARLVELKTPGTVDALIALSVASGLGPYGRECDTRFDPFGIILTRQCPLYWGKMLEAIKGKLIIEQIYPEKKP